MVVWQSAKDFRNASQVSTWIIGIAYRTALKSLRRQKNHTAARSLDDCPEQTTDPTSETEMQDWLTARLEPTADRTAADPGACLPHGPFAGGNRGDHRMSGGHGQGAHVSCAREIAPISARFERRRRGYDGEKRMNTIRRSGDARVHEEISALIPWYVNGSISEIDRQRVDAHLRSVRCLPRGFGARAGVSTRA